VLELVNQYPQEFDAIPFYSIGFTLGILSLIVWKQIWELSKAARKELSCLGRMRLDKE
jgi:hypothetical protein